MDLLFGFYQYWYVFWGQSKPTVIQWVHHKILAEFFFIWENQKHVRWKRMLGFIEKLCSSLFQLILHGLWWKLVHFHLVSEIPNVFMHYQLDEKFRHSVTAFYGPDWLAGMVFCHGLDLTDKFGRTFLIRPIRVRHQCYRPFVIIIRLIQLFSNPWLCFQIVT